MSTSSKNVEYQQRYRDKHRDKVRARGRRRLAQRQRAIQDIKLARGCMDCGYNQRAEALDFDHVRGEKKFGIGRSAGCSMDRLLDEIAKCEVVCANCHRIRTVNRRIRQ